MLADVPFPGAFQLGAGVSLFFSGFLTDGGESVGDVGIGADRGGGEMCLGLFGSGIAGGGGVGKLGVVECFGSGGVGVLGLNDAGSTGAGAAGGVSFDDNSRGSGKGGDGGTYWGGCCK
jgi:hypothetical protein